MNETLDYKLGNIEARLTENDRAHMEMTNYLFNIQTSINRIEGSLNDNKVELAGIKGKASVWGTVAGFLAGVIVTVIGWDVKGR